MALTVLISVYTLLVTDYQDIVPYEYEEVNSSNSIENRDIRETKDIGGASNMNYFDSNDKRINLMKPPFLNES